MNPLFLLLLVFVVLSTALFALGAALMAPASLIGARMQSLLGRKVEGPQRPKMKDRFEQAMEPLSRALPRSPEEVSKMRALLIQAGYREAKHLKIYLGMRILFAALGLIVVLGTGLGIRAPILLLVAPAFGYFIPRFILKRKVTGRQLSIRLGLADALDMMVVCVEAGLGLDQALARVAGELSTVHPSLSDELQLVNLEMRAGKSRAESLRNLALRTGVDDVRALVAVLIQTDKFGTSIAQALRVHSDSLRTERRQRAEEAAAKTTIKMVPVLVIFILPTMLFVTLGPAVIALVRTVGPAMDK
ncbi:MAG TPA: type II secretion system F family protein [Clostridia bacterium]|nr:type II secretion system F family protein [Clostridia bacterium]